MPAATSEEITELSKTTVAVHPLVLLSVVDHAARVARGTKRRVVGILLGQNDGKRINVANSYAGQSLVSRRADEGRVGAKKATRQRDEACHQPLQEPSPARIRCLKDKILIQRCIRMLTVPFEEDERDPRTWFLDHNFIEDMNTMFKKVNGTLDNHAIPTLQMLISEHRSQGTSDRMVSHWTPFTSVRSGDQ